MSATEPAARTLPTNSPPQASHAPSEPPQELLAVDPATGEVFGRVDVTPESRIPEIVRRSRAAQVAWSGLSFHDRAVALRRLRAVLDRRRNEAAEAVSKGMGKPLGEAMGHDVGLVLDTLDDYIDHAGDYLADEPIAIPTKFGLDKAALVRFHPRGVVVVIAPWNYPLGLALDPVITALAAGNSAILKPTSAAPLVGVFIEQLVREAFPDRPDLVQVVHGPGAIGSRLAVAPGVDFVAFTGSTRVGRELQTALAPLLRPALMELGGSDPAIVTHDANLERAANGVVWGRFTNNGQVCTAIKRVYVDEKVAPEFLRKVVEKVGRLKVGPYTNPNSDVGPLANGRGLENLRAQLQDALDKGAKLEAGGFPKPGEKGYFWPPTVLSRVDESMRVLREEVFGPILPIRAVPTEEEAIRLANDSEYGLGAYVFCGDARRGNAIANRLDAGSVDVNDSVVHYVIEALPFGGVKQSGIMRYHGKVGLRLFAETKGMLFVDGKSDREPYWFPYGKPVAAPSPPRAP